MRSLQPPDILWIHWRVYNFIANSSKGVLFLPPSDVYVRSFLYLLYPLIKLYYTKALSDQASSLPRIEFFSSRGQESQHLCMVQQQTFSIICFRASLSIRPTLSFHCCVQNLFFMSASQFLPCKYVHQYHFFF